MNYSIWVTARCNLGCRYCYEGENKPQSSMKPDTAREVLNYIEQDFLSRQSEQEIVVNFHGGEPLLEIDLIYFFINEVKKRFSGSTSVYFSMTTNATIMNERVVELLKDERVDMTLSIDGTAKTHDKLRVYTDGRGSHSTVMKNADKILRICPEVRVRMTYDGKTVSDLEENIKYLIDKGVRVIVPVENQFDQSWDQEGIELLEKTIINIKEYIKGREVLVGICDSIENGKKSVCRGGISGQHIYINGDIYPCMMVGGKKEFKIGSIYEGIDTKRLKNILRYSSCEYEECRECQIKHVCDGNRCKMVNKLVTGNYMLPSTVKCAVNNSIYKLNGEVDK